jgi:hypothetical protein
MGISTTSAMLVGDNVRSNSIKRWLSVAACAAVVGLLGVPARGDLLTNGNLNLDADGTAGPDGWSNWSYGPTAFAAYKTDPANDPFDYDATPYVNAGNYGDWWSSGGGWNQVLAGSAGVAYTFTAFCATEGWDNAAGEVRVIFQDQFGLELLREVRHTAEYQANAPWSPYTMTSIAPVDAVAVKVEFATWGARGAVLWDNANLFTANVWNVDTGGDFANSANWLGGTPNGVDAAARFLGAITDDRTIAIDSAVTLGSISFVNAKTYVLAGAGSLRLESSASDSLVDVQTGTHSINLPLTVASNTNFAVATGSILKISDPITVAAGKSLRPSGGGLVLYESTVSLEAGASILIANDTHAAGLSLTSTARATIAPHGAAAARVITVDALSIATDATLDIADNQVVVNYAGTSPAAELRARLATGVNGGLWNGPGISSSAAADGKHAVGYSDSGTAVTLQYTFNGDATLDGIVQFADLVSLAQNYNITSGATWSKGDFNYDDGVDFADLIVLAQNYGAGTPPASMVPANISADWALALTLVPEPTSLTAIGLGLATMVGRRRPPVSV